MTQASAAGLLREVAANAPASLSAPRLRLRQEALALLREDGLVQPAYSCRIVPLEPHDGPAFRVGGELIHAPLLWPASGQLIALGFGVITLGDRIQKRVTELFEQRKPGLALVLDDLANDLLMALSRRVQDRLLADALRQRLSMAGELHAGDPGLDLQAQAAVVRLAGGNEIGVRVHHGGSLLPLKSGSVVFGVGRNLPAVNWSRCDTCPSKTQCKYGRAPVTVAPTLPGVAVVSAGGSA